MDFLDNPFSLNRSTVKIITIGNIIVPLLYALYAIFSLIQIGPTVSETDPDFVIGLFAAVLWLGFSVYELSIFPASAISVRTKYLAFHMLAAVILLGITGFSSPLAYTWIFFTIVTYIYFGKTGMLLNLGALPLMAAIDLFLNGSSKYFIVVDIMTAIVIMTIGALSAGAMRGARLDQHMLDASKAQVALQRERFAIIINNLADAVLGLDAHGKITVFNAASLKLLETSRPLSDLHIDSILALYDAKGKSVSLHQLLEKANSSETIDDFHAFIDDEKVELEIKFSIVHDIQSADFKKVKPERSYIIMLRDITAQKDLERERDEFIAIASHELRTPVAIAEGSLSNALLIAEKEGGGQNAFMGSVKEAYGQILLLARMVNDLNTLSRAEHGSADTPEYVNITDTLQKLYAIHLPSATAKKLQLDLHTDASLGSIFVSRMYLEELLQNIIGNAIKYTEKGSVTISAENNEGSVVLSVKDTGIGIGKSEQSRVFERFYRAEDYRTRETSGTGLGLYVANKLAKKIGTEIQLKSRLNHGSTFSFELPYGT